MKNTKNQDNDKIIEFKSKAEQKKEKKKRKSISFKTILLTLIVMIGICIAGIALACPIESIKVEGIKYYTEADIKSAVKSDYYIPNTVFLKLRNKIFPIKTMPFVDHIGIRIDSRNQITIKVYENLRAGCISYAGKYVYFDKDGYALEVMNRRLSDVPLVTGLSYDNITISEKLPVKKKNYFSKIIKITTLITKNELTIEEIQFKKDGDIILKKDDILVNLGTGTNLDIKLDVLSGVLNSLKGKKGTVYMDQYTKENKIITFQAKK
jgi:cell division protein FtsQ